MLPWGPMGNPIAMIAGYTMLGKIEKQSINLQMNFDEKVPRIPEKKGPHKNSPILRKIKISTASILFEV